MTPPDSVATVWMWRRETTPRAGDAKMSSHKSQLKGLEVKGEIILNLLNAGRITQDQYTARLRKLVARAEVIFARMEAKAAG